MILCLNSSHDRKIKTNWIFSRCVTHNTFRFLIQTNKAKRYIKKDVTFHYVIRICIFLRKKENRYLSGTFVWMYSPLFLVHASIHFICIFLFSLQSHYICEITCIPLMLMAGGCCTTNTTTFSGHLHTELSIFTNPWK